MSGASATTSWRQALVGVAAGGYVAYLVWGMNWGTGSRNMALGTTFLIILPVAAFGVCLWCSPCSAPGSKASWRGGRR